MSKVGSSWRGLGAGSLLMVDLIVTVKPGSDFEAVAAHLGQAGMEVRDKLEAVGSVIGSARSTDVARLRTIPGVLDVTESTRIQLNPPGAPR
jgi:hypothetical protein